MIPALDTQQSTDTWIGHDKVP